MLDFNYKKTFEVMKAYAELGAKERKIMEYLFELDVFEGGYSQLAREINMDVANTRITVKYLDALGVVNICFDKPINEIEFYQNKNGKMVAKHNNMKACFIVDGWLDVLIKRYQDGNIYHEDSKKKAFIDYMEKLLLEEMK